MARYLHSDDFLRRKLLSRSCSVLLTEPLRQKLLAAGQVVPKPCCEWLRSARGGYGRMWNGVRVEDTHRIAYRLAKGPIPAGMDVLHHCDNPACWEESHLFLGTQADNNRDRDGKGRNGGHKNKGRKHGPSHQRGDKHAKAKLTAEQVLAIRRRFSRSRGKLKKTVVAREYGVSDSLIRGVLLRRNWAWLD